MLHFSSPTPLHGTARKPKATGVSKPNHSAESLSRITQRRFASRSALKHQSRVPGVGHTAARGHLDEAAIGIKFEHRLRVGGADFSELGRGEAERAGQTDHTETDIVVVDDGLVVAAAGRAAFAGVADPGAAASSISSLAAAAAISQGWSSPGATLLPHLVVPAGAILAALGSEQIDHPARRQPGRGGPRGPPVRFVVVNAGSIADAAQLLIEAVPESVSMQDARPSSRRRMAAANLRPGARSIGSYGRGENCSCS